MQINHFKGVHSFLSNFAPCRVTYEDLSYPSVEHAYVAAKTNDRSLRLKISMIPTAANAKRFGRTLQIRPDWNIIRLSVMEHLLRQKFSAGTAYARLLLETGDLELIEGNHWNDHFWGVCRGYGENHLGRLLMKIRSELRGENHG